MLIYHLYISDQLFDVEPKGGIAKSVAEGIDGGVDVTEAVGKHPDKGWNHVLNQLKLVMIYDMINCNMV